MDILNKHAPLKQKYVTSNQAKFMDSELNLKSISGNPLKTGQYKNSKETFDDDELFSWYG